MSGGPGFAAELIASVLVLLGIGVITLAVYGMIRLPGLYARLHAASKSLVLGLCVLLLAGIPIGDGELVARCVLIGAFLLVTAPVSAHAIGWVRYKAETDAEGRRRRRAVRRDS